MAKVETFLDMYKPTLSILAMQILIIYGYACSTPTSSLLPSAKITPSSQNPHPLPITAIPTRNHTPIITPTLDDTAFFQFTVPVRLTQREEASRTALAEFVEGKRHYTPEPQPTRNWHYTPPPTITPIPPRPTRLSPTLPPSLINAPPKQPLVMYGYSAGCCSIFSNEVGVDFYTQFVQYPDGQLLVWKGTLPGTGSPKSVKILEKKLSQAEICMLLVKLETLNFYRVETTGTRDEQDPLYKFGANHVEVTDGGSLFVLVNSEKPRFISVYEPYLQDVIHPMKDVLSFFMNYSTSGMTPYQPDRLLLGVVEGSILKETQPIEWPFQEISLASAGGQGLYVEGDEAKRVYGFFEYPQNIKIFIEHGVVFSIEARPVLPHETIKNILDSWPSQPESFVLPFQCGS